jgi:hypothetical protein
MWHKLWHIVKVMTSINLRQLRDTRRLKSLLQAGTTVELRERDRVLGRIVPGGRVTRDPGKWPKFSVRMKKIFGTRLVPGADLVIEERGRF